MIWQNLVSTCKYLESRVFIYTTKCCKLLCSGFSDFCRRGSIVGTRYLVSPNYHWSERLFWLCMLPFAFQLGAFVISDYARHFSETAYSVMIEEYPSSQPIRFPSVGICPSKMSAFLSANASRTVPEDLTLTPEFEDTLGMLLYQDLHRANGLQKFFMDYSRSLTSAATAFYNDFNYTDLALRMVNPNCDDLLLKCGFGSQHFDCCKNFKPEVTMAGGCLVLRTLNGHKLELNMSTFKRQRFLYINFKQPSKFFILIDDAKIEPITPIAKFDVSGVGVRSIIGFTLRPMVNDKPLEELSHESLNCYKRSETKSGGFSICLTNCVRQLQLSKCGCVSWHFGIEQNQNNENVKRCSLEGYACLERLGLFHFAEVNRTLIRQCQCRLNCNTQTVIVHTFFTSQLKGNDNEIIAVLDDFPQFQYRRQLVRRDVDIVVCLGGILSLFVGCNLINVFELFFTILEALFAAL